jgi:perosamine synthetase
MRSAPSTLALHGGAAAVTRGPHLVSPIDPAQLKAALGRLIDDGVFSDVSASGPIADFERSFAAFVGAPYCLSFSSGTAALLNAYLAVGVGPGDEVVHPCYSWISALAPAVQLGARPVFCDVERDTLLADPASIERQLTPRTKAICVVHMHGNVCRMDEISAIARRNAVALIEDCSHCHGAQWGEQSCGLLGDIGCFSLQGAPTGGKAVAAGEGGIAVTRSRELHDRMLLHGHINRRPPGESFARPHWNALLPLNTGMKHRMHPWAAACASLMLERVAEVNAAKRDIRSRIERMLAGCEAVRLVETAAGSTPAGFYGGLNLVYRPEAACSVPVEDLLDALRAEGGTIGRAPCPLLHRLPFFAAGDEFSDLLPGRPAAPLRFPDTERVHAHVLNILHPMNLEPDDPYLGQLGDSFVKVFDHIAHHRGLVAPNAAVGVAANPSGGRGASARPGA